MKPVNHIKISGKATVNDLVKQMKLSGVFGAGALAEATEIAELMIKDKDCRVFFGLAGAMVPGGMKQIIIEMLKKGWIDVLVTTGANLTHDLVEALGFKHYIGDSNADDKELNKKGIDRVYDSYMPNKAYENMEEFIADNFDELSKQKDIKSFLWKLGSLVPKKHCESILATCAEKKIPIFCPAIADSGIGLMVWGRLAKGKKIDVGAFDDLKDILDIAWTAKKTGVFYVGGGVPKNYIQQAMQFSPKAAEYGIQITMESQEPGGSSGARLKEGVSWGKMNPKARYVDVVCDATIALPIIFSALKDRIK